MTTRGPRSGAALGAALGVATLLATINPTTTPAQAPGPMGRASVELFRGRPVVAGEVLVALRPNADPCAPARRGRRRQRLAGRRRTSVARAVPQPECGGPHRAAVRAQRRPVRRTQLHSLCSARAERFAVPRAVGTAQPRADRQRHRRHSRRRHPRGSGVGQGDRIAQRGRRDRGHRYRLLASGSRRERLVGAGELHGDDRRTGDHVRGGHARIQRDHEDLRSVRRSLPRDARQRHDRRERRQRHRRRRHQLVREPHGPQVPERERNRFADRRDQRDRVRDPGEGSVPRRRRERARPLEQLGGRRVLAGAAR